ncbi:MAG: hypothetical protein EOO19_07595, partial [Chryseobacterium sp.]
MKRILLLSILVIAASGCGINKQAQQMKALEKCTYRITSADEISVGGTDVKKLFAGDDLNIASLPGIAFGLLRKDVPLKARLNLEVKNPTTEGASINQ